MKKYYFRSIYDDVLNGGFLIRYEITDNPSDDTPFILNDIVYINAHKPIPIAHIDNQPDIKKALIKYKLKDRKNKLNKLSLN